jgi:hypothetical protein
MTTLKTGLFSTIVTVFIVESYKKLSPDSSERTTVLLEQISLQLAGFQNNTYPKAQDSISFAPRRAYLWVNALWFLSLVTSIVSAFYVMLVQQWVRRYTQTTKDLSSDQGRVRSSLFLGTQKYQMSHAIGLIPLPLHISVFLFFSGLIIFLFTISHTIGVLVSVSVGIFGLAYAVLTLLPIINDVCPYFTPMSDACWYLWHASITILAFCLRGLVRRLSRRVPYDPESPRKHKLAEWRTTFDEAFKKHKQRIKDGLRGSIVRRALDAPVTVDLKALTWLIQRPAMAVKSNIQGFLANIPGDTLIQLMSAPKDPGKTTLRERLSDLLGSCVSDTVKLEEKTRRDRLIVCLDAVHDFVKASFFPDGDPPSLTLLDDVRSHIATPVIMHKLWDDDDPAIRLTSRSICALLARLFLKHDGPKISQSSPDWLEDIIGKAPSTTTDGLPMDRMRMNLESFVYGVLSNQENGLLEPKHAASFAETLGILMNAGRPTALDREIFEEELFSLVKWAKNDERQGRDKVVAGLRDMLRALTAITQ